MDVKICGVCRADDARLAAEAGADWVGVILAPGRTRTRTVTEAGAIFEAAPLRRAGVFVDQTVEDVARAARDLALDAVQLHGDETRGYIKALRELVSCDVWKAIRVRDADSLPLAVADYMPDGPHATTAADALVLDGWSPAGHGGVGARFDWSAAARVLPADVRVIVAGGLTPGNVAAAVSILRPAMVDVSSGVEEAVGLKSPEKVQAFIAAARGAKDKA